MGSEARPSFKCTVSLEFLIYEQAGDQVLPPADSQHGTVFYKYGKKASCLSYHDMDSLTAALYKIE